jgi:hypothetical protein
VPMPMIAKSADILVALAQYWEMFWRDLSCAAKAGVGPQATGAAPEPTDGERRGCLDRLDPFAQPAFASTPEL